MSGSLPSFSVVLVCAMLCLIPAGTTTVIDEPTHWFVPCSDEGPSFLDVWSEFGDIGEDLAPQSSCLFLHVCVWDEDGVDTVIGGYSEEGSDVWSNITMQFWEDCNNGGQAYNATGPSYTLDLDHRTAAYRVRYYANDSLGNWNASETVIYSNHLIVFADTGIGLVETILLIAVPVIAITVIILYARRKREMS